MVNVVDVADSFNPIEHAGHMLERHASSDSAVPNLLEVTGVAQHRMATASGLNDYDYQKLSTLTRNESIGLNQIETVSRVPIPPEIMEHFKHIKCHCMMGLFPEIGRAWLTIDSDLYIWTYENIQDVAYFDGVNHLIISVALVRPKPNVFIADVQHLLIVTTPIEVVVLGVVFANSNSDEISAGSVSALQMQLMDKPIFTIATDNVAMTAIVGTADNRILLGGRDGCVYEIVYQAESNWFGKRCKKINHSQGLMSYVVPGFLKVFSETDSLIRLAVDDSRKMLYTLSEKGAIEVWDLGTDSGLTRRIARWSANDVVVQASKILRTVDTTIFKPIVSICPLTDDESPNIHLLCVTQDGVRLYFSARAIDFIPNTTAEQGHHSNNTLQSTTTETQRPYQFQLLHIRLPPGYTVSASVVKPKSIRSAFYTKGTLLMVSTPQQDQDLLWSLSSEPFPMRPYLTESSTLVPLSGQVWSIAKAPLKFVDLAGQATNSGMPTKVVLLTNQGTQVVAMQRPVHMLQQLLFKCRGPNHDAVRAFFESMSPAQACASAISLACMSAHRNTEIGAWSKQAFVLYGGDPCYGSDCMGNRGMSTDAVQQNIAMSTPFQSQFHQSTVAGQTFGSPIVRDSPRSHLASSANLGSYITFSHKHTGLYLHVSRVLDSIWTRRCLTVKRLSSVSVQECSDLLDELNAIRTFIDSIPARGMSATLSGEATTFEAGGHLSLINASTSYRNVTQADRNVDQALAEEYRSISALAAFLRYTSEVLALWKIICEHQFTVLLQSLPCEEQTLLASFLFRDLILSNVDTCAQLIIALINVYLKDNASVGSISEKLRSVCPQLYRHEDAVTHKATELLQKTYELSDPEEISERLHVALQLCRDAAPNIPLSSICAQFRAARFDEGVVQLCAAFAQRLDPTDAALHYYKCREPAEDQEGYVSFTARMKCYKEIGIVLDHVHQTSELSDDTRAPDDQRRPLMRTVAMCLQTSDQLLHIAVYDWLLTQNLYSDLLNITEPSLGDFLAYSFDRQPDNLHFGDILWKYHERNGRHDRATIILDQLASSSSEHIQLDKRIEYLARAVMCTRCDNGNAMVATQAGALLKNLEDKLEVARVQKLILDAVSEIDTPQRADAVRALNYALYDISHLYTDFAEPFALWECKLAILNCSHHNDQLLIESVWSNILQLQYDLPGGTAAERLARLIYKVRALSGEYGTGGPSFPLAFIVHELELHCCRLRQSPHTVPDALFAFGNNCGTNEQVLEVEQLLDLYGRMMSMNERIWATEGREWHLVEATAHLVSILADQANVRVPSRHRRRVLTKAQELMSTCRNLLYPKPGTKSLIDALVQIEAKLQRHIKMHA